MKVIYIHQYFKTPRMSGGTRSYEMARRMVAAGWSVNMVTSKTPESPLQKGWVCTCEEGIVVHWYYLPYSNKMNFIARMKAFCLFSIAASFRAIRLKADIIFATSTPLTVALPGILVSKSKGVPMVFEVRDLWPDIPIAMGILNNRLVCWFARKLETITYHNSASVVALSPGMKEGIVRTGYPDANVAVIPNSCDIDLFRMVSQSRPPSGYEKILASAGPLILYAGTLGQINGTIMLVDLAVELKTRSSDVRILVVGDGADRDRLKSLAISSRVYGVNFFMADPVSKEQMPFLLRHATIACSLFIDLPEMRANSANKVFDAMAAGTPVLINYGGWMNEFLVDKNFGLSVWGLAIKEMAILIDEKLHDEEWLSAASDRAISMAKSYFDRDILAAQLLEVLSASALGDGAIAADIAPGIYL